MFCRTTWISLTTVVIFMISLSTSVYWPSEGRFFKSSLIDINKLPYNFAALILTALKIQLPIDHISTTLLLLLVLLASCIQIYLAPLESSTRQGLWKLGRLIIYRVDLFALHLLGLASVGTVSAGSSSNHLIDSYWKQLIDVLTSASTHLNVWHRVLLEDVIYFRPVEVSESRYVYGFRSFLFPQRTETDFGDLWSSNSCIHLWICCNVSSST